MQPRRPLVVQDEERWAHFTEEDYEKAPKEYGFRIAAVHVVAPVVNSVVVGDLSRQRRAHALPVLIRGKAPLRSFPGVISRTGRYTIAWHEWALISSRGGSISDHLLGIWEAAYALALATDGPPVVPWNISVKNIVVHPKTCRKFDDWRAEKNKSPLLMGRTTPKQRAEIINNERIRHWNPAKTCDCREGFHDARQPAKRQKTA